MMARATRFAGLLVPALLTGNEVGTWTVIHPALGTLDTPEQLRAEQAVVRRYAAVMPALMTATVASVLPALRGAGARRSAADLLTMAGLCCFTTMLGVTLVGNVPLNVRLLRMSSQEPLDEFRRLRRRWDRLHTARVALDVTGLCCLLLGALTQPAERG